MATLKKIGFLADTHWSRNDGSDLRAPVLEAFEGCDAIVHLGDIGKKPALDRLAALAPVWVQTDDRKGYYEWGRPQEPVRVLVGAGGATVGIVFNLANPDKKIVVGDDGLRYEGDLGTLLSKRFKTAVDVVAFGGTHRPYQGALEGVLFFNPGSPTLPMEAPGTVAVLDVSKKKPSVHVVPV